MELDTGASLSIMSKNTFRKHWPSRPLESTTRKLTTYTGETIDVLGTAQVQVTHGENSAELELMIVDMDGPRPSRKELVKQTDSGLEHATLSS